MYSGYPAYEVHTWLIRIKHPAYDYWEPFVYRHPPATIEDITWRGHSIPTLQSMRLFAYRELYGEAAPGNYSDSVLFARTMIPERLESNRTTRQGDNDHGTSSPEA